MAWSRQLTYLITKFVNFSPKCFEFLFYNTIALGCCFHFELLSRDMLNRSRKALHEYVPTIITWKKLKSRRRCCGVERNLQIVQHGSLLNKTIHDIEQISLKLPVDIYKDENTTKES